MNIPGLLLNPLKNVSVSYAWYNKQNGIIKWRFMNPNNKEISFILLRGINYNNNVSDVYPFGNAFYPVYYENFGVEFALRPVPLKNTGIESNSPPLAVFENPDDTKFVAFLFTLAPGETYEMLEGGWNGIEPGGISTVTAHYISTGRFSIKFNTDQCSLYNSEANENYPCPENPLNVRSSLMSLRKIVKPLFNDNITPVNPDNLSLNQLIWYILEQL
ncbi:hypothetical protein [Picrophilus oshimae]|uniref:Uncharacterized protein n=1 Tax=Picrophilus torridus (strain ATCC 700027 / DSM 9790 / JCM 10055 / NBRC 100828 / KAW 2/3) TaxID=1122961 RepID=Q6L2U8_PICTO|nr:hypothetical protein [Picrophilus oshimae]AAT42704.1 hypothetical protein PTO0119 [Picrophilus oshimae DSM 9789]